MDGQQSMKLIALIAGLALVLVLLTGGRAFAETPAEEQQIEQETEFIEKQPMSEAEVQKMEIEMHENEQEYYANGAGLELEAETQTVAPAQGMAEGAKVEVPAPVHGAPISSVRGNGPAGNPARGSASKHKSRCRGKSVRNSRRCHKKFTAKEHGKEVTR